MDNKEIAVKTLGGQILAIGTGAHGDRKNGIITYAINGEISNVIISDNGYLDGCENKYITCLSQDGYLYCNDENKYDAQTASLLGFVIGVAH